MLAGEAGPGISGVSRRIVFPYTLGMTPQVCSNRLMAGLQSEDHVLQLEQTFGRHRLAYPDEYGVLIQHKGAVQVLFVNREISHNVQLIRKKTSHDEDPVEFMRLGQRLTPNGLRLQIWSKSTISSNAFQVSRTATRHLDPTRRLLSQPLQSLLDPTTRRRP